MRTFLAVNRRLARERSESLLTAMGLAEKRDRLARTLSGGMQRRLSLILAMVHDPEVLVLDEPEAGLDPQSRVLVREFIRSLGREKTVILTTHNMDEAERLADRVAIIDRGRLLALDTPEALKRQMGPEDILEVTLVGDVEPAPALIQEVAPGARMDGDRLVVTGHGVAEHLPDLLAVLRRAGLATGEIRLRPSTLEDLFLALTGRRLRE